MWSEIGAGYLPVVQTGLQTLTIIAAGRLAAARGLFDPAPTCRTLNRFVMVVCLPALQFWLLAIKTDMRNMEHWRCVGAFMLWTVLVQVACAAWVLVFEGGKMSRIAVHSLVLVANNTGILAPVVLEAAVGPSAAAVGMLATIALYFQQLPVAMVLFELDRMGGSHSDGCEDGVQAGASRWKAAAQAVVTQAAGGSGGGGERQAGGEPSPPRTFERLRSGLGRRSGSSGALLRSPSQLVRHASSTEEELPSFGDGAAQEPGRVPRHRFSGSERLHSPASKSGGGGGGGGSGSMGNAASRAASSEVPLPETHAATQAALDAGRGAWLPPLPRRPGAVDATVGTASATGISAMHSAPVAQRALAWDAPREPQTQLPQKIGLLGLAPSPTGAGAPAGAGTGRVRGAAEPGLRHAAQLVMGNALMWTTGAATAVSMMGLHSLLDPAAPTHAAALGFVEGTLSWLARCSVPVSLFAMGLWTASIASSGGLFGGSLTSTVAYLAIKLLGLPWLMVFVNSVLGLSGRLGRSLVVLTCVPVGQNAFLVTEQYGEGMREVMQVMQLGLMLMLPHVAAVLAALRWMGLYDEADGIDRI